MIIHDYEIQKRRFVSTFKNFEAVIGIFQYGSVKAPGLSDIDIIVVLDDKLDYSMHENVWFNRPVDLRFDLDRFKIIPSSIFDELLYLGDISLNELYSSSKIISKKINSEKTLRCIMELDIWDWMPERISNMQTLINSNTNNLFNIIGGLYSLRHSVFRLRNFCKKNEANLWLKKVDNLRNRVKTNRLDNIDKNTLDEINYLVDLSINFFNMFVKKSCFTVENVNILTKVEWEFKQTFLNSNQLRFGNSKINKNDYVDIAVAAYLNTLKKKINYFAKTNFNFGIQTKDFDLELTFDNRTQKVFNKRINILSQLWDYYNDSQCPLIHYYRFGHVVF